MNEIREIQAELAALRNSRRRLFAKGLIASASIILFAVLSRPWLSWYGAAMLIAIILIHEAGHLWGMKRFGYKDLQMLFIPFLGAGVSGTEVYPKGTHKAIITLLGPLPGILFGALFGILFLIFNNIILFAVSGLFLLINGMNLLPLYPSDGGRFLDAVLFSRNRKLELFYKIMPVFLLSGLAAYSGQWWICLFVLLILMGLPTEHKILSVANEMRGSCPPPRDPGSPEIPDEILADILDRLKKRSVLDLPKPRHLAKMVNLIWQKINFEPPGKKETLALLAIYIFSLSVVFLPPLVMDPSFIFEKRSEQFQKEDGSTGLVELTFLGNTLFSRYEVSEDNVYHGRAEHFVLDRLTRQGEYYNGKWHGTWTYYDTDGEMKRVQVFDKGRLIKEKRSTWRGWRELELDDLPKRDRNIYIEHENGEPLGPRPASYSRSP